MHPALASNLWQPLQTTRLGGVVYRPYERLVRWYLFSVCLSLCVYIYLHITCVHTERICIHMCVFIYLCIYIYIYICVYRSLCVREPACHVKTAVQCAFSDTGLLARSALSTLSWLLIPRPFIALNGVSSMLLDSKA